MNIDPEDLPDIDWRAHLPSRFDFILPILAALLTVALLIYTMS